MTSRLMKRHLSLCLVLVMLLTAMLPVSVFAAGSNDEGSAASGGNAAATTMISDYATFLSCFKVLEGYAKTYAEENAGEDANALIINYIRTGVERYTSGTWEMVCGKENTAFTAYVSEQDTANNTSASALKNLGNFTLPNGNKVDLGHVFGAMDVANYAKVQGMTDAVVQARADMGSWAGDIADLMFCAENVDIPEKVDTTETDVDILAANIRTKYLGVDYGTLNSVDHSFTDTDLYGDMDAFYLTTEMNRGGVALSTIIENYFTAGLTDASRASYFLTNRLGGMVTKDGIRSKVLSTYTGNTLIGALESSYSLTDLPNCETLRKACCYAFADYLFDLAGDPNGTDPVDPDPVDPDPKPEPKPDNAYYSVFSSDTTTVAPGVTQTINYALTKDDKQIVYYIATADIAREDVSIHANYHDNDPSQGWAMHRQSSPLSNSCSLLLSHISHPYIDICISAPHRFSTKPSRGKGSIQILNLQIAVQKYPFKVRNSSKYRLRHSCTKTNIFCKCRCVCGAFVEFATPRVTQNIVILSYYSTLHIQMQLNQQRNGRKKYVFVNLR